MFQGGCKDILQMGRIFHPTLRAGMPKHNGRNCLRIRTQWKVGTLAVQGQARSRQGEHNRDEENYPVFSFRTLSRLFKV
jgi:hypothetical protein